MRLRSLFAAVLVPTWLVACSVIVTDDVPAYHCSGDDPASCPEGLVCYAPTGTCISPALLVDGDAPREDVRDPEDAGPTPIGVRCGDDGDCTTGLCGTSSILTTAITPSNVRICTRACCTSEDCPPSFVCFPPATGGNYCVAAQKAGRTPPPSGGKGGGITCNNANECRSGLCTAGRCVDTCCDGTRCAGGALCKIGDIHGHKDWVCGAPTPDAAPVPETCPNDLGCQNNNCAISSNGFRCTPPCCKASDCAAQGLSDSVCAYGQAGRAHLKWCFDSNPSGKPLGAPCGDTSECSSGYCDGELGICLNVCCTNSDCANDELCQPSPGSTPFLRCVKTR